MIYKINRIFLMIFIVVLMVALSSVFCFSCVNIEKDMVVSGYTEICEGSYKVDSPIKIRSDSILKCNNVEIDGLNTNDIILISNVNNITVDGCIMKNVERGINVYKSSKVRIINNQFNSINRAGVSIVGSVDSSISGNTFRNNSNGIYIDDYYNVSFKNESNIFIGSSDMDINEGVQKIIKEEDTHLAPKDIIPSIRDIPKTTFEPEKNNSNNTEKITNINVSKTKKIEYKYTDYERKNNILDDILINDREIDGYFGIKSKEDLERMHRATAKIVKVEKTVCVEDSNAKVTTRVYIEKDIKPLVIYEHIPKNLAYDTGDIIFDTPPYRVIKADPLIMWYYPEAHKGEVIETSYVIKDVDSNKDFSSYDTDKSTREQCNTKVCDNPDEPFSFIFEVEEPLSVVIGKQDSILRVVYILFPIVLIPIVIFIFIYGPKRK